MKKFILFSLCLLMAGQVFGLEVIKNSTGSQKMAASNSKLVRSESKSANHASTKKYPESSLSDQLQDVTLTIGGHEYVDLGLPSGTKWATCNIGASSPEECGAYFAWGETLRKTDYSLENYLKDLGGSMSSYDDCGTDNDPLANYVHPNEKSIAGTQYDVARVLWGANWKMPTLEQLKELYDSNYCITTWTTQNGVVGEKIVSKKNGNSIFLPAAGFAYEHWLVKKNVCGTYWSATPYPGEAFAAYYHEFGSSWVDCYRGQSRNYGRSVRPVVEENTPDDLNEIFRETTAKEDAAFSAPTSAMQGTWYLTDYLMSKGGWGLMDEYIEFKPGNKVVAWKQSVFDNSIWSGQVGTMSRTHQDVIITFTPGVKRLVKGKSTAAMSESEKYYYNKRLLEHQRVQGGETWKCKLKILDNNYMYFTVISVDGGYSGADYKLVKEAKLQQLNLR